MPYTRPPASIGRPPGVRRRPPREPTSEQHDHEGHARQPPAPRRRAWRRSRRRSGERRSARGRRCAGSRRRRTAARPRGRPRRRCSDCAMRFIVAMLSFSSLTTTSTGRSSASSQQSNPGCRRAAGRCPARRAWAATAWSSWSFRERSRLARPSSLRSVPAASSRAIKVAGGGMHLRRRTRTMPTALDDLFPAFEHLDVVGDVLSATISSATAPAAAARSPADARDLASRGAGARADAHGRLRRPARATATRRKPAGAADHANYSKRTMARDQVRLMQALGFERFDVLAHDRGARVAHRLAADQPAAVRRLPSSSTSRRRSRCTVPSKTNLPTNLLALVLPDPARAAARAPDRGRPGRLRARGDRPPPPPGWRPVRPARGSPSTAALASRCRAARAMVRGLPRRRR